MAWLDDLVASYGQTISYNGTTITGASPTTPAYTSPTTFQGTPSTIWSESAPKDIFYTDVPTLYAAKVMKVGDNYVPLLNETIPPWSGLIEVDTEYYVPGAIQIIKPAPTVNVPVAITTLPDPELVSMLLTPGNIQTLPMGQNTSMLAMLAAASNDIYSTAQVLNALPASTFEVPDDWDLAIQEAFRPTTGPMTPARAAEIVSAVNTLSTNQWDTVKSLVELVPEAVEEEDDTMIDTFFSSILMNTAYANQVDAWGAAQKINSLETMSGVPIVTRSLLTSWMPSITDALIAAQGTEHTMAILTADALQQEAKRRDLPGLEITGQEQEHLRTYQALTLDGQYGGVQSLLQVINNMLDLQTQLQKNPYYDPTNDLEAVLPITASCIADLRFRPKEGYAYNAAKTVLFFLGLDIEALMLIPDTTINTLIGQALQDKPEMMDTIRQIIVNHPDIYDISSGHMSLTDAEKLTDTQAFITQVINADPNLRLSKNALVYATLAYPELGLLIIGDSITNNGMESFMEARLEMYESEPGTAYGDKTIERIGSWLGQDWSRPPEAMASLVGGVVSKFMVDSAQAGIPQDVILNEVGLYLATLEEGTATEVDAWLGGTEYQANLTRLGVIRDPMGASIEWLKTPESAMILLPLALVGGGVAGLLLKGAAGALGGVMVAPFVATELGQPLKMMPFSDKTTAEMEGTWGPTIAYGIQQRYGDISKGVDDYNLGLINGNVQSMITGLDLTRDKLDDLDGYIDQPEVRAMLELSGTYWSTKDDLELQRGYLTEYIDMWGGPGKASARVNFTGMPIGSDLYLTGKTPLYNIPNQMAFPEGSYNGYILTPDREQIPISFEIERRTESEVDIGYEIELRERALISNPELLTEDTFSYTIDTSGLLVKAYLKGEDPISDVNPTFILDPNNPKQIIIEKFGYEFEAYTPTGKEGDVLTDSWELHMTKTPDDPFGAAKADEGLLYVQIIGAEPGMVAWYNGYLRPIPSDGGMYLPAKVGELVVGWNKGETERYEIDGIAGDAIIADVPLGLKTNKEMEDKGYGEFVVTQTFEGQQYFLNGVPLDMENLTIAIEKSGYYTFASIAEGYDPEYKTVFLAAGQSMPFSLHNNLVFSPYQKATTSSGGGGGGGGGSVRYKQKLADPAALTKVIFGDSLTGCQIWLDTNEVAPVIGEAYDISPGYHAVQVRCPEAILYEKTIYFGEGDTLTVSPVIEYEENGEPVVPDEEEEDVYAVSVQSDPGGAKILIDGFWTGQWTPDVVYLYGGFYTLSLYMSGYISYETPLWVADIPLYGQEALDMISNV